jgi:hypothetical protein
MIRRGLAARTEAKGTVSANRQNAAIGPVERPNVSGFVVKLARVEYRPEIKLKPGSTTLMGDVYPNEFLAIK